MTWEEWVRHHASLLGFRSPEDVTMLAGWSRLFAGAGFTPGELREATDWLAVHSPPEWRADHLRALQDRVRSRRAAASVKEPVQDGPRCDDCNDSGFVIVPEQRQVAKGRWGTAAVLCWCPMGRRRRDGLNELAPPTIEAYERAHPDWREQVEQHRREELAYRNAQGVASSLDRALGAILGKLGRKA